MDGDQYFLIPFYEYMKTIIGVTTLPLKIGNCNDKHIDFKGNFITEFTLNFDNNHLLTESRKHNSNKFDIRLVMRFCKNEDKILEKRQISMVDCFPQNLKVDINSQPVKLSSYLPYDRFRKPGRMNPRLLDITNLIFDNHSCTHTCNINWVQDDGQEQFNFALYLVRRRSFEELSNVLINFRIFSVQNTINLLSERTIIHPVNNKSNIEYMFQDRKVLNASLVCPLSLSRMKIPVRGGNCTHLKCFDLLSFLIINFQKPTWNCPICDKKAFFCLLKIDGIIFSIINDERSNLMEEIKFNEHGQWKSYDEDSSENSDTDSFYDIPGIYYNFEINNEQCNGGSNTQRCSETISGMNINKDAKNILPMSDWRSLKNEYCCSNNSNMVASLANNTISNVNSKSLSTQNIAVKKSIISNGSQSNPILNSKTLVFQEKSHQTNLNSNSNNNSTNNLKRTHVNSSSESSNEKELPVKKPTLDSRSIPKVNGSKTVTESVHNDQPNNTDSDHPMNIKQSNQLDKQEQHTSQKIHSTPNQSYTMSSTCPSYRIIKLYPGFYKKLKNFIFEIKIEPYTTTFNGITTIPNMLKYNTFDRDMIVIKFNVAQRYKLNQLTGLIEIPHKSTNDGQEGKRVVKEIRIHVTKTLVKLSFLQQDLSILQNNTMVLEVTSKFDINMLLIEIQDTPSSIAIEIIYYETIVYPFSVYRPLNGLAQVNDVLFFNQTSFLKFQHLNDEDINQLTVFVDIKVGQDVNNYLQMFEITILDFEGKILLNESTCPRERILHFRNDVTGYSSKSILGKKDSYEIIIKARQLTYGKVIIGFDIGQKIKSIHITHKHIVGYRDLAEEKWRLKYAPNVKEGHMKLINLIEAAFKPIRNLKPIKSFLGVARQDKIFTTKEKIWLVRMTYNQIRLTEGWEDTITHKTINKEPNISVTIKRHALSTDLPSTSSNTIITTQSNQNGDSSEKIISLMKLGLCSVNADLDIYDDVGKTDNADNGNTTRFNINNTCAMGIECTDPNNKFP